MANTKVTGQTMIADIIEDHPLVVDYLIEEYGFFCFSCFLAGYETLAEGARVHGIEGEELEEMIADINTRV